MKKVVFSLILIALVCGYFQSCKEAEVAEVIKYVLSVVKGDGVSGTPDAGSFSYETGQQVAYDYSAETGFSNPRVKLDRQEVAVKGTITINANHTLEISCEKNNYSGIWLATYKWQQDKCGRGEGEDEKTTMVHTGDDLVVTASESGLEFAGTVSPVGTFQLTGEEWDDNVTVIKYTVEGRFTSLTEYEGTNEAVGYRRGQQFCTSSGTFTGKKK